jgi:hypothetical protein
MGYDERQYNVMSSNDCSVVDFVDLNIKSFLPSSQQKYSNLNTFYQQAYIQSKVMSSSNNVSHQDITAAGLSEADQNINNSVEDRSHQAAGHKANLSNPSTSSLTSPAILLVWGEVGNWDWWTNADVYA